MNEKIPTSREPAGLQVGAYELLSAQEKFLYKYSVKHIFEKISLYLSVQKSITEWNFLAHTALSSE